MAHSIPETSDALLTRRQTAEALTEAGFPVKAKTLATKATRGGGPPFSKFGLRALYRWDDALSWARRRLTAPYRNTSEQDRTADATLSRLQRDRSTDAGESLSDKFQSACATSPVAPGRAQ
jgi:hypothetical protein